MSESIASAFDDGDDIVIESLLFGVVMAEARARRLDVDALLTSARLPLGVADVPGVVSLKTSGVQRLMDEASFAFADPHLGLSLSDLVPEGYFGIPELAARVAPTVVEGLGRLARYCPLLVPSATRFACRRTADALVCTYGLEGAKAPFAGRHANEMTLALLLRFVEQVLPPGQRARVTEVSFANAAVSDVTTLVRRFGTRAIRFDAKVNALSFDLATADARTRAANRTMLTVLDARAEAMLAAANDGHASFDRALERAIVEAMADGEPTVARVAARLGAGPRTLQRRLKERSIVFRDVTERLRYRLAREQLIAARPVAAVARALGYADGRAFARAFRRWSDGTSPTRYRASHRTAA